MIITRWFEDSDRYACDFGACSINKGFAQVDTSSDASYYGTWANPTRHIIVTYCEGDFTVQKADSVDEFSDALRAIQMWHNNNHAGGFKGIDCAGREDMRQAFVAAGVEDLLHHN